MALNKTNSTLYDETVDGTALVLSVAPLPSDVVPGRLSGRFNNHKGTIVDWVYRFDRVLEGTPFRYTIVNTQVADNSVLIAELQAKVTEIATDVLTTNNIDLQAIEDARLASLQADDELLEEE